jgi:hypothetical protein
MSNAACGASRSAQNASPLGGSRAAHRRLWLHPQQQKNGGFLPACRRLRRPLMPNFAYTTKTGDIYLSKKKRKEVKTYDVPV